MRFNENVSFQRIKYRSVKSFSDFLSEKTRKIQRILIKRYIYLLYIYITKNILYIDKYVYTYEYTYCTHRIMQTLSSQRLTINQPIIKGKKKKKRKRKEKIEIKKIRKENYVKFQQFSFYTFIPTSRKYWVFCNTLLIVRFFYSFFMYHIFYRMKHSSAILNTHSELSKIRFFANILEIDPIRYLHRLLKNVCKNWIDRVTLWWEYRFEWVFCYILLRLTFTMKRQNESWKSVQLVTLIFGSRFIYESVILLYCLSYRKKYRLVILWIFFPIQSL